METKSFLQASYQPNAIEKKWYALWEQQNLFQPQYQGFDVDSSYCIVIPPPNVTGTLHMGHGFQYTLMDALIRYHRMQGLNTLWQVGTDHAGIATQMVVERQLHAQNLDRHQLGRNKFIEKVWEWKDESGDRIAKQIRRLGASVDWSRERFTMDQALSKAVRDVFIQLYEEGLIYRGKKLVNWDPVLLTAISDLEVTSEEEQGTLWFIRYSLIDSSQSVTVATTRPETMLGDVALAVHPDDPRYQMLIGKMVKIPISHRIIPIIADDSIDQTFGTGCVKITPAHDFNDYKIGIKHGLALINIFTPDAKLNEHAPIAYQNLDRFVARKKLIAQLKQEGLLEKEQPHTLSIPKGDRSGAVIEPYLTNQWFVHTKPLAEPAYEIVKRNKIRFVPEAWTKVYYQWMENIEDWCISRQLWWGHQIPAWYDEKGNIYVGESEKDVRIKYQLKSDIMLTQDQDVLDTWFSAALWPFATLGWPENSEDFKLFYPTQVLVTGFDIIFFWVARMIMFGLKFTGNIPFHTVYITGLIRDGHGQKMSKSKGNIIDPLDLIDGITLDELIAKRVHGLMQPQLAERIVKQTKRDFPEGIAPHGCDALRFTFAALATHSRDINFDMSRLNGYKNFCNKIWNAAKFVLLQTEDFNYQGTSKVFEKPEQWILLKLNEAIQEAHRHFKQYRFDLLAQKLHEFIWHDFCDWYIELAKASLALPHLRDQTQNTLVIVFESLLRLLHPLMPHLTEELWHPIAAKMNNHEKSIMLQPYPSVNTNVNDNAELLDEIKWLIQFITVVRNMRSEMNMPNQATISLLLRNGSTLDKNYIQQFDLYIKFLLKVESVAWIAAEQNTENCLSNALGDLEIFIPLNDTIHVDTHVQRLLKLWNKLDKDYQKMVYKLYKTKFKENAPKEVVEAELKRFEELHQQRLVLRNQLDGYISKA